MAVVTSGSCGAQVFIHRQYGYRGVVVGWDEICARPPEWLEANGLSPRAGDQPFYYVLPHQPDCLRLFGAPRVSKYVAQENLVPVSAAAARGNHEHEGPVEVEHSHVVAYFRRYSKEQGRFCPCPMLAYQYPNPSYPSEPADEAVVRMIEAAQRGDGEGVAREMAEAEAAGAPERDGGGGLSAPDQWGSSALHWAAHNGHAEVARCAGRRGLPSSPLRRVHWVAVPKSLRAPRLNNAAGRRGRLGCARAWQGAAGAGRRGPRRGAHRARPPAAARVRGRGGRGRAA
jgi:hemimethylated DNA binding protein